MWWRDRMGVHLHHSGSPRQMRRVYHRQRPHLNRVLMILRNASIRELARLILTTPYWRSIHFASSTARGMARTIQIHCFRWTHVASSNVEALCNPSFRFPGMVYRPNFLHNFSGESLMFKTASTECGRRPSGVCKPTLIEITPSPNLDHDNPQCKLHPTQLLWFAKLIKYDKM